jgi:acyl-CoA thioesterase-1
VSESASALYSDRRAWEAAVPEAFRVDPAFRFQPLAADEPALLVIGDSISMGYTPTVRDRLAGHLRVARVPDNAASTARTVQSIEAWLGGRRWSVIHANWGLHDLRRVDPLTGEPAWGRELVPLDAYRVNLEQLVERLAAAASRVLLATTTPVPPGSAWRRAGDERRYNAVLLDVARRHGLEVVDLWRLVTDTFRPADRLEANVHYPPEGYARLGEAVAAAVLARPT